MKTYKKQKDKSSTTFAKYKIKVKPGDKCVRKNIKKPNIILIKENDDKTAAALFRRKRRYFKILNCYLKFYLPVIMTYEADMALEDKLYFARVKDMFMRVYHYLGMLQSKFGIVLDECKDDLVDKMPRGDSWELDNYFRSAINELKDDCLTPEDKKEFDAFLKILNCLQKFKYPLNVPGIESKIFSDMLRKYSNITMLGYDGLL
ncbi:uncharacterized protein LOC106667782 isoform X4 [Cimex lectularius]|nr:uncharacterized protein LOC106667782 isoform X4 [Cimex lectularius]